MDSLFGSLSQKMENGMIDGSSEDLQNMINWLYGYLTKETSETASTLYKLLILANETREKISKISKIVKIVDLWASSGGTYDGEDEFKKSWNEYINENPLGYWEGIIGNDNYDR